MYVILGVVLIFLFLIILSAIPLLKLKYHNDVAEHSDIMTQHCYRNIEINFLPENNKYIYIICSYLFDNKFQEESKIKTSEFTSSNKGLPEIWYMKLYREYIEYSITLFLLGALFLFFCIYLFVYKYFYKEYTSFSLLLFIVIMYLLYIIIFALILKKITEIYNDTDLYKYYNLLKLLNDSIKKYKETVSSYDFYIFLDTIVYDTSLALSSENYSKFIIFNDETISYMKTIFRDKKINMNELNKLNELFDMHSYFHSKKHKDNIKYRINVVTSFLYAYIVFVFFLIYFLFKILHELLAVNLVYIYASIVLIYFLTTMLYFILISIQ